MLLNCILGAQFMWIVRLYDNWVDLKQKDASFRFDMTQ